jgi:UDP-N-acetylglucosamine 2-epimerase (non-hydrolysing)
MVYFFFGTKAQIIKSEYVLKELNNLNINIKIINTNQHVEITNRILNKVTFLFEVIELNSITQNANSVMKVISFFLKNLWCILFKRLNIEKKSYCILHGDTLSTLLGVAFCKRYGLKIIHIEAGYKSKFLFKPFPEELIRRIVTYFSDYLVCDGEIQYGNLTKYKSHKKIIRISQNTIADSVFHNIPSNIVKKNNLIITLHRTENIFNKKKLLQFIELITSIQKEIQFNRITWYLHETTRSKILKIYGLSYFDDMNIQLLDLVPHNEFIKLIAESRAVITDGGSIKQECSLLNIPTLIWRDVDDDPTYSTPNILITNYSFLMSVNFLKESLFEEGGKINQLTKSPSKELADQLLDIVT